MKTIKLLYLLLVVILSACSKKDAVPAKSSAKNIISFSFNALNPVVNTSIDSVQHIITATLPTGTDLSKLVPTIVVSSNAIVSPASGVVQDFTKLVTYTVTAEDGSIQRYVVNISATKSSAKEIKSVSLFTKNDVNVPAIITIDTVNNTVNAVVAAGTDISFLRLNVLVSDRAKVESANGYHDFNIPVIYTIVAEDGSIKNYKITISFKPVVNSNGTAYFGANDGKFYAIDIETGTKKWEFRTGDKIVSSPTASNGMVFFGSNDNNIYALDAKTGEKKWSYLTSAEVMSSPYFDNGVLYIGSNDGYIYAINANNGTKLWSYKTISKVISSPVLYQGVLFVGCMQAEVATNGYFEGGVMYAIDSQTGKLKWENTVGHITSSPAISNGTLYVVAGYFEAHLIALKTLDGKEVFDNKYYNYTYKSNSSPTIDNNTIFVGGGQNALFAFDLSGNRKWATDINNYTYGSSINSSPIVSNGLVYMGSWDGKIHCLNAVSGTEKWNYYLGSTNAESTIVDSPTLANGYVYFGNDSSRDYNKVACLDASTGEKKWEYVVGTPIYSSVCVVDSKGNVFHSAISGTKN